MKIEGSYELFIGKHIRHIIKIIFIRTEFDSIMNNHF